LQSFFSISEFHWDVDSSFRCFGAFLVVSPLVVAVISDLWVWDGSGLAIGESESLIEIWAVLQSGEVWTMIVLHLVHLLASILVLVQGPLVAAVVSNLWVWDGSSPTIGESESLIEVWAVLQGLEVWTMVVFLLAQLVVALAVESNSWISNSLSLSIGEGHSLIEVWAVRKAVN